ncbi:MAG TPA: branched-chain amino acid ABC transporter permease [Syntrophorhabdales bacterium]|nr:branched-chain amino acid ABC transporter permease [Syntrophorhabdales bacterium]
MRPVRIGGAAKFFLAVVLLGCIAFALGFLPNRWQQICIMWAIWSTVGMSWLVILRVGEFSVGQAGFLCIGGYSAAVLMLKFDCPFWLALIVSAATCGFVALVVGVIILRLKGLYFLVISLVFAEIVRLTIAASDYLGASEGLFGIPIPNNLWFIKFSTKQGWLYLFIFILALAGFTFRRMEKSRIGRIYSYIGASSDLAQSFGIYYMKYRVQAFVISAFFTGLVGAAMGVYLGAVGPEGFTFYYSLIAQIVAILGGVGSIVLGPLLGSALYTVFDEYLVYVPGARSLIMGALLLTVIFFLPAGLVSVRKKLFKKKEQGASSIGTD